MSETRELKACPNPWCGEKQSMARVRDVPKPTFRVICKCGVMGPMALTEAEAITAWNTHPTEDRLVGALEEAERALEALISTFTPQTPLEDPVHGEEVATLGRRIGFGALMVSAAATWRDQSCVAGGEFVVGPCALTADVELAKARAALTRIRAAKGGE